jgi:hypothetical protein
MCFYLFTLKLFTLMCFSFLCFFFTRIGCSRDYTCSQWDQNCSIKIGRIIFKDQNFYILTTFKYNPLDSNQTTMIHWLHQSDRPHLIHVPFFAMRSAISKVNSLKILTHSKVDFQMIIFFIDRRNDKVNSHTQIKKTRFKL